jgi:hypothetical protein
MSMPCTKARRLERRKQAEERNEAYRALPLAERRKRNPKKDIKK